MRTKILTFIMLMSVVVFSACTNSIIAKENLTYSSADEAIEKELSDTENLLSKESYQDVTLVFFEKDDALGVSVLTENNGEFNLTRNEPFHGFDSDGNYAASSFEVKISDESKINILAGKVFDPTINQIILEDNKTKQQVEIWNRELDKSELFYFVLGDAKFKDKTVYSSRN